MNEASVGFQCPECVHEGRRTVRQPSKVKNATVRAKRIGYVTATLIGLNVLAYVATAVAARSVMDNYRSNLFGDFALYGAAVDAGQWYRLVTAMFLHYGLLHLAVNMLSLYIIGQDLERFFGRAKYAALYLLSGVGGSFAAYLFSPGSLVAGASGAIFGLLGAAVAILTITKRNPQQLIPILVINLGISFLPGISLAAHVGGLVTGAIVGGLFVLAARRSRR